MTEHVSEWGENAPLVDNLSIAKLEEYGTEYTPIKYTLESYKPFSLYPFILRDIAAWVPTGADDGITMSIIKQEAGGLLARIDLFDSFTKENRTSYAFRLVFEAMDRTLTDVEINSIMGGVTAALASRGYEIR
jgi:phenylalanyl-tRNA synthetase beta chain